VNPEAPTTHHWFDPAHITYGVVTVGLSGTRWQVEASSFGGQEPEESRWDIATPTRDSWSLRATWSPSPNWAVSRSHGLLKRPEVTHPGENERRTIVAASYANRRLAATVAYAQKVHGGDAHGGFLTEATFDITPRHALFGRVETVDNEEVFAALDPLAGRSFSVVKATLGSGYTMPIGSFGLTLGGSAGLHAKPVSLDAAYGCNPKSFTLFAKRALGQ